MKGGARGDREWRWVRGGGRVGAGGGAGCVGEVGRWGGRHVGNKEFQKVVYSYNLALLGGAKNVLRCGVFMYLACHEKVCTPDTEILAPQTVFFEPPISARRFKWTTFWNPC